MSCAAYWSRRRASSYKLKGEDIIDKRSDYVLKIKGEVDALFANGRTTSLSDEEMEDIIKGVDPKRYEELLKSKKRK